MILSGTLVQYLGGGESEREGILRARGVYTVTGYAPPTGGYHAGGTWCEASTIWLCEASSTADDGAFCFCRFRILAPPITEADRLELTAPDDGAAPAVPVRQPAKTDARP